MNDHLPPSTDVLISEPEQAPTRGEEHERLQAFVGDWVVVGENKGDAQGVEDIQTSGEVSFEWLSGEFFLINRWNRASADGGRHIGLGVIGFDVPTQAYFARHFDNLGFYREYRVSLHDHSLTYDGEHERATMVVSREGAALTIRWEALREGEWRSLCELRGTRKEG